MMIRTTTSGVLKGYRMNLQQSAYRMNRARERVETEREFNSFAEDPTAAARTFQLRRSYLRNATQYEMNEDIRHKYDVAYKSLDTVQQSVDTVSGNSTFYHILVSENDPDASARNALGQSMKALADDIVHAMNGRYGENYVFSGADGLNVPFEWQENADGSRTLLYRTKNVNAAAGDPDLESLDYLSQEKKFADIGLGFKEEADGTLIESSAKNIALHGINFLGYGQDGDGDPKNIAVMIDRMSVILRNCDPDDGHFATESDETEFRRLAQKFEDAASTLKQKRVEQSTEATFLENNSTQLKTNADSLQEQFFALEKVDPAFAISDFGYAKYCYDTALKVGNSILAQSLMDYINM